MSDLESQIKHISQFDDERLYEYFSTEPLSGLHTLKLHSDDIYYNTGESSGFQDFQYDMLKDVLEKRDPDYVVPIGAKIRQSENRAELPYWLGSMDKKVARSPKSIFWKDQEKLLKDEYDADILYQILEEKWNNLEEEINVYEELAEKELEKDIHNWTKKNKSDEYVLEYKLDGVSCLLIMNKGKIKLYTRGDGIVGADISYLAQYFDSIPKNNNLTIAVRGELIMKEQVFEEKHSGEHSNPRNLVAGRIGGKTIRKGIKDIDFVAYEIVGNGTMQSPSEQLEELSSYGFDVVHSEVVKKFTIKSLTDTFKRFREESPYEIDGIIVQPNKPYVRNKTGNPSYAFAFKLKPDASVVEVLYVEWNVSKWGVFKPRVRFTPIRLLGADISYATGHNAKYILENNIGPGSKIKVIRSGDVIPYIDSVVQGTKAQMPEEDYNWNETGVDIYTTEHNPVMCIKLIAGFFDKLGIKHVSEATVEKMYEDGLDTLLKIISADKQRLMQIERFKEKSAERIYNNIRKGLQNVSIPIVLGSSGIFGFGMGRKRITALMNDIPELLDICYTLSNEKLKEKVIKVEGFSDKTADKVVNNAKWASKFIVALGDYATFKKAKKISADMKGLTFVFTGFRDTNLEEQVVDRGGKISTSVSGKTTAVITNDKNSSTGKPKKAKEKGIPVYDRDEFKNKYNFN